MIRRTSVVLALVAGVFIGGVLFSPIGPLSSDSVANASPALGDSFGLNFKGKAQREPTPEPNHFQYSNPLYSMITGEKIGTATHDVFFTEKPGVLDHTMTFRLADGELVAHQLESAAPDPQYRPGTMFLIGIHPPGKTIDPSRSTGAYKGRTGSLRMKGQHETSNFPAEATFDDFYWIQLDPK